jgi:acyl-CoA thioesterase
MITDISVVPATFPITQIGDHRFEIAPGVENIAGRDVAVGSHLMAYAIIASGLAHGGQYSVKSAHGIFARVVKLTSAVELETERYFSGRNFGAETVTIRQDGRIAARVELLLTEDEDDLIRHAETMPEVGKPEDARPFPYGGGGGVGLELRVVGDVDYVRANRTPSPPRLSYWARLPEPVEGLVANQALLCGGTSTMLIGTAFLPHPEFGEEQAHRTISTGVIGHTMNFHEPFDLSEWVLVDQESVHAGHGRAHGRGLIFSRDGQLIATMSQDAMIRHFADGRDHSANYRSSM